MLLLLLLLVVVAHRHTHTHAFTHTWITTLSDNFGGPVCSLLSELHTDRLNCNPQLGLIWLLTRHVAAAPAAEFLLTAGVRITSTIGLALFLQMTAV